MLYAPPPRVYINSSSVTIWILVEVRWAITSIVAFMDGYFGPTHMVFLNVQYLNIFGPDRLESTILKITSLSSHLEFVILENS